MGYFTEPHSPMMFRVSVEGQRENIAIGWLSVINQLFQGNDQSHLPVLIFEKQDRARHGGLNICTTSTELAWETKQDLVGG